MLNRLSKIFIKIALKVLCYQLKRKAGIGKEFKEILNTKNITEDFNGKELMFIPIYIHVNINEDKYYFTHNGILVGIGNLDGLDPVEVIKNDCIDYGILYQYITGYALGMKEVMNAIIENETTYEYLIKELERIVFLMKKKTV